MVVRADLALETDQYLNCLSAVRKQASHFVRTVVVFAEKKTS